MRRLVRLILASSIAFAVIAAEPSKPAVFQMRLVLDAPSADSERMTLVHKSKDAAHSHQEALHVQKTPLLDETSSD